MFSLEGPEGFEPTIIELQSIALTELGYGPKCVEILSVCGVGELSYETAKSAIPQHQGDHSYKKNEIKKFLGGRTTTPSYNTSRLFRVTTLEHISAGI